MYVHYKELKARVIHLKGCTIQIFFKLRTMNSYTWDIQNLQSKDGFTMIVFPLRAGDL